MYLKKWYAHYQAKAPARAVATKSDTAKPKPEPTAAATESQAEAPADGGTKTRAECETGISGQQQSGFVKTVPATGQSESAVARTHRVAQAFKEEQLEVLAQMSVNQTDILRISKIKDEAKRGEIVNLIASGMEPADAIYCVLVARARI